MHKKSKQKTLESAKSGLDGSDAVSQSPGMDDDLFELAVKLGTLQVARMLALGPTLKAVRGLLDLTQEQLASKLMISKRTVIKMEAGKFSFDYMTYSAVKHGLALIGVDVELRSGRLCVSLEAAAVNKGLGEIASKKPDMPLYMQRDLFPN